MHIPLGSSYNTLPHAVPFANCPEDRYDPAEQFVGTDWTTSSTGQAGVQCRLRRNPSIPNDLAPHRESPAT